MRNKSEDLKDEVYRQMFRLEESRTGAEMSLALALLRAWLACSSKRENCEERKWLKTISPICLAMIETALRAGGTAHSCLQ
jgi:cell division FtsZ-interacting protein ZapD